VLAHRMATRPQGTDEVWLSTLAEEVPLQRMVFEAKMRWRIERDYQDLKQEAGLGHCEGRGWRAFHHRASLSIAAYGFLMGQRLRFPNGAGKKTLHDAKNLPRPQVRPRITSLGAAQRTQRYVPSSIPTLRLRIAAALLNTLPRCRCCLRVNARLLL
jgi:hypothetical protein